MSGKPRNIVVVGQGAAGLAAALAAVQEARARHLVASVTLLDKAPEADAGGNTRWSPSYMRMAAPDRVETSFVHDMLAATQLQGDETYFATLAAQAPATVKWIAAHGVEFIQPIYYLAKGPPRIQPQGGGPAIVATLARSATITGVHMRYGCAARSLVSENGRLAGIAVEQGGRARDAARRRRRSSPAAASKATAR